MSREDILEKVNEIFREVFEDDDIVVTEATTANDIEDWDSLMHITLISEIESAFGFRFAIMLTVFPAMSGRASGMKDIFALA